MTIGAYDGVHLGHRALLADLARAGRGGRALHGGGHLRPPPGHVVRPESAPLLLTDLEQKLELLADCGIDRTLVVPFDRARADESAEDFVDEVLVDELSAPGSWWWGRTSTSATAARATSALLRELGGRVRLRGRRRRPDRRRAASPVSSTRIRAPGGARATWRARRALLGPSARGAGPGGPRRRPGRARARVPDRQRGRARRHRPAGRRRSTPGTTGGPTAGAPGGHLGRPPADLLRAGTAPVLVEAYCSTSTATSTASAARVSFAAPPARTSSASTRSRP